MFFIKIFNWQGGLMLKKNTFVNLWMDSEPIIIECELLQRKKQSVITTQLLLFALLFVASRFLTPPIINESWFTRAC